MVKAKARIGLEPKIDGVDCVERVAHGPNADLFRARVGRRTVAVKLFAGENIDRDTLSKFVRGGETAVRHPNLLPVLDVGVDGRGRPFYTMPLISGDPLSAVLAARSGERRTAPSLSPLSLTPSPAHMATIAREAAALFADALDGLEIAHAAGVAHGRLHPGNLILTPAGRLVITDFGRAAAKKGATTAGDHAARVLADIHAVGVALARVVEAESTPDGDSADERRDGRDRPSGTVTAGVPDSLLACIAKASATDPEQRYHSAAAFAADLRRFLRHEQPLACFESFAAQIDAVDASTAAESQEAGSRDGAASTSSPTVARRNRLASQLAERDIALKQDRKTQSRGTETEAEERNGDASAAACDSERSHDRRSHDELMARERAALNAEKDEIRRREDRLRKAEVDLGAARAAVIEAANENDELRDELEAARRDLSATMEQMDVDSRPEQFAAPKRVSFESASRARRMPEEESGDARLSSEATLSPYSPALPSPPLRRKLAWCGAIAILFVAAAFAGKTFSAYKKDRDVAASLESLQLRLAAGDFASARSKAYDVRDDRLRLPLTELVSAAAASKTLEDAMASVIAERPADAALHLRNHEARGAGPSAAWEDYATHLESVARERARDPVEVGLDATSLSRRLGALAMLEQEIRSGGRQSLDALLALRALDTRQPQLCRHALAVLAHAPTSRPIVDALDLRSNAPAVHLDAGTFAALFTALEAIGDADAIALFCSWSLHEVRALERPDTQIHLRPNLYVTSTKVTAERLRERWVRFIAAHDPAELVLRADELRDHPELFPTVIQVIAASQAADADRTLARIARLDLRSAGQASLEGLARLGATDQLLEFAMGAYPVAFRLAAIDTIRRGFLGSCFNEIRALALTSPSNDVRTAAFNALREHSHAAAVEVIPRAIDDLVLRSTALEWLSSLPQRQSVAIASKLLGHDQRLVRQAASDVLRAATPLRAAAPLATHLFDRRTWIRNDARRMILDKADELKTSHDLLGVPLAAGLRIMATLADEDYGTAERVREAAAIAHDAKSAWIRDFIRRGSAWSTSAR